MFDDSDSHDAYKRATEQRIMRGAVFLMIWIVSTGWWDQRTFDISKGPAVEELCRAQNRSSGHNFDLASPLFAS